MLTSFSFFSVWVITLPLILLIGCDADFTQMAEKRLAYASSNQGDIEVVAIQSVIKTNYIKGVLLAADEINHRSKKLLGRKIKVHIEPEGKTFDAGKSTFRRIAANPKITAVLGHRRSSIAVPVSVIYEQSDIIFLSSFSTIQSLTGHNFQYVFRMAPNAKTMGQQIASVAHNLGYKKMVILYGRDTINRELAFLFEDGAIQQQIELIKRSSFSPKDNNYRPLISQFSNNDFDAVFIASSPHSSAVMVKQLREMGVQQPILGSDSFNNVLFAKVAGDSADNVIAPSFYKPNEHNEINQHFVTTYRKKHKHPPDFRAAQGYDSLMLLAIAIERAGNTTPSLLASTLHYMPAWVGVTGLHSFSPEGEMLGKKYFFKTWEHGEWRNLTAIHMPYLLERFTQNLLKKNQDNEPTKDKINYVQRFSEAVDEEQHKMHLLSLSQHILDFKNIGIIYENTQKGREIASYNLLKRFSKENKINLLECYIPISILNKKEIQQQFFSCFGKLSLSIDALFLPVYPDINQKMLEGLSRSLASFKIPAISLDQRNTNPNLSLLLGKRSDINLSNMNDMQIYNGLLHNIKLNVFAKHLKNLPEISANLYQLQQYDFSDDAMLNISPSNYFNTLQVK
jgi:branched-chain amino acid transport system substrate-binding protein